MKHTCLSTRIYYNIENLNGDITSYIEENEITRKFVRA